MRGPVPFQLRWSALMVLVSTVLMSGAGVAYTSRAQHRSDQRWCDLMSTLDQSSQPPTTERGRVVQQQIHRLRAELGCGRP